MKLPSLSPALLSLLVAVGGALLTAGAWRQADRLERQVAEKSVAALLDRTTDALADRLKENARLLRGVAALMAANPGTTRAHGFLLAGAAARSSSAPPGPAPPLPRTMSRCGSGRRRGGTASASTTGRTAGRSSNRSLYAATTREQWCTGVARRD